MASQNSYHLYLIVFTLEEITRKMIEDYKAYSFDDELTSLGNSVYEQFNSLEKNLGYFKNRFIILNFNVGLYLGNETMEKIKEDLFFEADLITEINPIFFKPKLMEKTQKEYNYLVAQYLKLNAL